MTTGLNSAEVLGVIDSLQVTAAHRLSTPAQGRQVEDGIVAGSVCAEQPRMVCADGWDAPGPCLRIVASPAPGAASR